MQLAHKHASDARSVTLLKEEVVAEDIADIVALDRHTVSKMVQSDRDKLLMLEEELHKRVIGQDNAIEAVANAVADQGQAYRMKSSHRFFLFGFNWCWKNRIGSQLAEFLFNDAQAMIRIDMSEYMEKHSVSR